MNNRLAKYCVMILAGVCLAGAASVAQIRITTPANGDVSPLNSQFVSGTAPTGFAVCLAVNGVPSDTVTVRPDGRFEFIGVHVPVGPIVLTASIRFPNGKEARDERAMHIIGPADSLVVESASGAVQADGRTKLSLKIKAIDKWGYRISNSYFASIDAGGLMDQVEDQDPNTAGLQRRIVDGETTIQFTAPKEAGDRTVKISMNSLSSEVHYTFTTPVEPLMLVGSADASASDLKTSGDLSALKDQDLLKKGLHTDGRLAFYGRGTIWSDYLLTASYDNNRREDRLFKEVDPDVLYSLYGDNSTIDYTAQTNNPFFLKLERNRSYAMFGDFNTELSQNELARYDRTFNGVKAHYETKTGSADAFATLTDRKVVQDELRGQGISGYYFLGKSNIIVGSEKVRIETRDRYHNEVIISRLEKARFGDYEIDYQQGTLFFKQPVAAIDGNGNPVYIIATYEAAASGASDYSYVVGAQAEKEILGGWRVGGTAVHDRSNNDFTLLGANTKVDLNKRIVIGGEFAHGSDKLNAGGSAWRVDGAVEPLDKLMLKSYYRKVEAGFINQTMGAGGVNSEAGSMKYGGGASYTILDATKLAAEYYRSEQSANNKTIVINSTTGSADHAFGSVATLGAKIENVTYETPGDTASTSEARKSTIVGVRGSLRPFQRLNITGEYEHSLNSSAKDEVMPSAATIGAEYRVIDPIAVSVNEKFFDNGGSASLFGITSEIGYGTTAQARYQIGNAMSGQRNQMSIGLKNVLHLTDALTSNVSYERTRALDRNLVEARTQDNDAVSVGLEYLPKAPLKASIKGELAKNAQSIRRVATFGGDIALVYGFSLIDKVSYYEESRTPSAAPASSQAAAGTFAQGTLAPDQIGASLGSGMLKKLDNIAGLAYRPVDVDWLNAIGKYEKKMEFNGVVAPQTSYDVDIASLHAFVEPIVGLEIGMKYALKHSTDEAFGLTASTLTDFYLVRAEYDLRWNNFDVAAEYRVLDSRIIDQANSGSMNRGYSAELGCVAIENIHIGVGYNFVGTQDRDLVSREYWSAGPFVTFRAKFTEKLLNYFSK
jgi:hypothetical protein